jgi:hypothetical protein
MTIDGRRLRTCGFQIDDIDLAVGRHFHEGFSGFLALRGPHKVGASPLRVGCEVGDLTL